MTEKTPTGLALMRAPFPDHQISRLPKESKAQIDERKSNRSAGISCAICGGWHHRHAVHLDYVGHAALTDRLLDCDPAWSWAPMTTDSLGLPQLDATGGLWIRLTVCGVTRLGYGHADKKERADAGAREKEVIGDALRNAAMRFGAALDLWHKGDLHIDDEKPDTPEPVATPAETEYEAAHLPALRDAALRGNAALQAAFAALGKGDKTDEGKAKKKALWDKHSARLKTAAAKSDGAIAK